MTYEEAMEYLEPLGETRPAVPDAIRSHVARLERERDEANKARAYLYDEHAKVVDLLEDAEAKMEQARAEGYRAGVEACLAVCRERAETWDKRDPHERKVWENVERIIRDELPPPPKDKTMAILRDVCMGHADDCRCPGCEEAFAPPPPKEEPLPSEPVAGTGCGHENAREKWLLYEPRLLICSDCGAEFRDGKWVTP